MRRLIEYDPLARVATWFHKDAATGECAVEDVQDVAPYIEWNKRLQASQNSGRGLSDYSRAGIREDMWHVARIPVGVQYRWLREKGINIFKKDHQKAVLKLLNDPEWRYLRTGLGRV